jgi:uncharacterized YceG family protein
VSGGYGPGGHPGQGYGPPDRDGHPGRTRPQRQGNQRQDGQQQWNGSVWRGDHGYARPDVPPGYGGQEFGGPGYHGQDRGDQGHGGPGYDPRDYGQPGGDAYPLRGEGAGGYRHPGAGYQDAGPRPGQYGVGGRPAPGAAGMPRQYDQQGTFDQQGPFDQQSSGPRRGAGGYDQRGAQPPGGTGGYGQGGGYDDWEQDQSDSSFLPGFDRRDEYDDHRTGGRAPERDDYADYGDRRGRPPGRGPRPGPGDRGSRGPGTDPRDTGSTPPGRDDWNDTWDDRDRQPRKKATRWIPRILVLTIVAVIVIGGLVGGLALYHKYEARYHPADYAGPGTGDVTVQVMGGDTAFSLAPRLLQLGVIASTRAFTNAAEAAPSNSTGLEVGYYVLHQHMQASLAYAAVTNPKNRVQTTVTIPEGKRAVDVIAILAGKTKIPLKDFQQALASPAQLGLPSYANGKVEGYLFPATYAIVPHETALQILQAMVQRFNVEAQQANLVSAAQAAGLTPTQLVIEASLAQAEGGSVSDYPKIAEVIHNRLATGMHLQFDSTVLYGLGKYAVSATFKQINTPGPYNSYLNAGLPPGPISNPGDAAIQGVLHPDHGNFLYFLTKPGGQSEFSPTPLKGQ